MENFQWHRLAAGVALALSTTLVGCGGDSSSDDDILVAPLPTLDLAGGRGGLDGGDGGEEDDSHYFQIDNFGGDVIVGSGGPAPKAGITPTNLGAAQYELGDVPMIVDTDLSPAYVAAPGSKPAAGTYYVTGDGGGGFVMRQSDGNTASFNAPEVVTGIMINKGRTLTLPINETGNTGRIDLEYDVIVKGTLTVAAINTSDIADININGSGSVLVFRSGTIDTAGKVSGQNGGDQDYSLSYSMINQGKLIAYGADGAGSDNGGDGGDIYPDVDYYFESTNLMDAHGGDSEEADGGEAGWIDAYADYGDCVMAGRVMANGGDGATGGGDGNDIICHAESVGDVKLSGVLSVAGGDAGSEPGANGGDADYFDFYSYGGGVYSSARLEGWGGTTQADDGDGGDGAYMNIYNYSGGHYQTAPPMGVNMAGQILFGGGDALADGTGDGGDVNYVYVYVDDTSDSVPRDVVFHFGKVDLEGGDGNYPGDGGDYYIYNFETWSEPLYSYLPSGTISQGAMIDTSGGHVVKNATNGARGGSGGDVNLESDYYYAAASPEFGLVNVSARIDMSGGDSRDTTSDNAEGGDAWIWGYNGVTVQSIDASGGDDLVRDGGSDGNGGDGDEVELYSELGDIKAGTINVSGGDGEYEGGDAGFFGVEGNKVSLNLVAHGGDADPALAGSVGGDLDDVYIWSVQGNRGVTGVSISRDAGTGETEGSDDYYLQLGGTCSGTGC